MENTVLVDSYKSLYPARYSLEDNDKHVLHAGGEDYQVSFDSCRTSYIDPVILNIFNSYVTLFVLNSTFLIWSPSQGVGLELPYTLIALHALKDVEGSLALYLQIIPCSLFTTMGDDEMVETLDLLIREGFQSEESQNESSSYPQGSENIKKSIKNYSGSLFSKKYSMQSLYDALSTCSALHYDSESENEGFNSPSSWITEPSGSQLEVPSHWINSGDADDLGNDAHIDHDGEAGMNIDVGETAVIGVRRKNSDGTSTAVKTRRVANSSF